MGNHQSHHFHTKLLEKVEEAYITEATEPAPLPEKTLLPVLPTDKSTPLEKGKSSPSIGGGPQQEEKEKKPKSSKFQSLAKRLWKNIEHESGGSGNTRGFLNEKQAKRFFDESYEYFQTLLQSHGTYFNPNIPKEQIISEWMSAFDLDNDKKLSFDEFVHALQVMALATHPEIVNPKDLGLGENPILHETFTYDFYVPPHLKKYVHEESKTQGREVSKDHLPLELTGLGIELVVDGFEGSGVRTLVKQYAGSLTENNYAQCHRDIFNKGIPISVKAYLHPQRNNFESDYLPVTQEYPFRFHLIVLVFDLTAMVTDLVRAALATKMSLIKKYLDQTYETVPHPPLLFLGNKMEAVSNLPQVKKDFIELAEKYNAMYACVSAQTGLFVSKSFRQALTIATGNRFGYKIE